MADGSGEPNTNRASRKRRACMDFFHDADIGIGSSLDPRSITPYLLYNITEAEKNTILQAITQINPETLLILVLGESNTTRHGSSNSSLEEKLLSPLHNMFEDPLISGFDNGITILIIDPAIQLEKDELIGKMEVSNQLREKHVESIVLVKTKFPLTPVYGPHKEVQNADGLTKQPSFFLRTVKNLARGGAVAGLPQALRRLIHTNALQTLQAFVDYPQPLFISSRITTILYRSFKYLIDMRAQRGKHTTVYYGYTFERNDRGSIRAPPEIRRNTNNFPLFPRPFTQCNEDSFLTNRHLSQYYNLYRNKTIKKNEEWKTRLRAAIHKMDEWANNELESKIPPAGGKRKTRKNKRKH